MAQLDWQADCGPRTVATPLGLLALCNVYVVVVVVVIVDSCHILKDAEKERRTIFTAIFAAG